MCHIFADVMRGLFCMPFSARVIVHVLHSFVGFLADGLTVLRILGVLRYSLSKPGRIDGDLDGALCAVVNPGKVWEDRNCERETPDRGDSDYNPTIFLLSPTLYLVRWCCRRSDLDVAFLKSLL